MFMSVKPEKNKWELKEFVSCPSPSQKGEERWGQWPEVRNICHLTVPFLSQLV